MLIDHKCFSSCLLVASILSFYPKTIFIGQPSSSNTQYGEVATLPLPGGATLQYPMAAFRNPNHYYLGPIQPTFIYTGDMNNTNKLIQWFNHIYHEKER